MFKIGQLVKSEDTGVYYTILKQFKEHVVVKSLDGTVFPMRMGRIRLVGNNYRVKQNAN